VPPALEAIILKALSPDRELRHRTAAELQEDVERYLRDSGDASAVREVGRLVAAHFADHREHISAIVEAETAASARSRVRELPTIPPPPMSLSGSGGGTGSHSSSSVVALPRLPGAGGEEAPTRAVAPVTAVSPSIRARPWRRRLIGAAVLASVAAGAFAAVWILTRAPLPGATHPGPSAAGGPAAATGAPTVLTLRLESTPSGAEVRLAERLLGVTPLDQPIVARQLPGPYVISLAGYAPYRVELGPLERDRTVLALLVPLPASATAPSASSSAAPAATSRPTAPPRPTGAPPPDTASTPGTTAPTNTLNIMLTR
jgi:serine/threonine-protein kinase